MTSQSVNAPGAAHPPLGTFIDEDALQLVEVLGVGGYGVVYRAVDTRSLTSKSYAVKCLLHCQVQDTARRQVHIREIALHQIASAHPGIVTLHRVIEDYNHTYIVMDYATDHDLFTQICHKCLYLGQDALIKHVFLQLLDAVEHCHSLGIYHRDLKPENVLCFDGGLRVAITDFGLATIEKESQDFQTGSVYHMSPECHGGSFAPSGSYSPMSNDVWSLGIILLNLATGRSPWNSATQEDPTFQAYLRDPMGFLPTILPISLEVNDILTGMLEANWRHRMTLAELRLAIENVNNFYSENVIFEGCIARGSWEAPMDDSSSKEEPTTSMEPQRCLKSCWSQDSSFGVEIGDLEEPPCGKIWKNHLSSEGTCELSHASADIVEKNVLDGPWTLQPEFSISPSNHGSSPTTPDSIGMSRESPTVELGPSQRRYYSANTGIGSISPSSSAMYAATEYPSDTYSVYHDRISPRGYEIGTRRAPEQIPLPFPRTHLEMTFPSGSSFSYSSSSSSSMVSCMYTRPGTPSSSEIVQSEFLASTHQHPNHGHPTVIDILPTMNQDIVGQSFEGQSKASEIFGPLKSFPCSSLFTTSHPEYPFKEAEYIHNPPHLPSSQQICFGLPIPGSGLAVQLSQDRNCQRSTWSKRHWFMPGKFFTFAGTP